MRVFLGKSAIGPWCQNCCAITDAHIYPLETYITNSRNLVCEAQAVSPHIMLEFIFWEPGYRWSHSDCATGWTIDESQLHGGGGGLEFCSSSKRRYLLWMPLSILFGGCRGHLTPGKSGRDVNPNTDLNLVRPERLVLQMSQKRNWKISIKKWNARRKKTTQI